MYYLLSNILFINISFIHFQFTFPKSLVVLLQVKFQMGQPDLLYYINIAKSKSHIKSNHFYEYLMIQMSNSCGLFFVV